MVQTQPIKIRAAAASRAAIPIALLALLFCLPDLCLADGSSCVFSALNTQDVNSAPDAARELTWLCTSDPSAGTVSSPTITGNGWNAKLTGRIDRVQIIPGSGGNQPSSGFNLYLYSGVDSAGTDDLLGGLGAASSNVNVKTDAPLTTSNGFFRKLFNEVLTPKADSCGNSKQFTLKILLAR